MKPFWEDEYLNKEKSTFGNPSKEVKELVPYLKKDAKILDVGCGDGRHALYLASLGFQVDAFDLSKNAIEKIDYSKQKNNLNIHLPKMVSFFISLFPHHIHFIFIIVKRFTFSIF